MDEQIRNPYVGPRSFGEADEPFFFGRSEERSQLTSLIIAHQVVLFYAQSGAGKTSLVKASIIPELKRRRQLVALPTSRVYGDLPPGIQAGEVENIYVFNTLVSLAGAAEDPARIAALNLNEGLQPYFQPVEQETRLRPRLLILDQFEELFTRYPERYEERADFFQQLQICLENYPQLRLLLSMREDYIAELDFYAGILPDRLRTRYRMERLNRDGALAAIEKPAAKAGRPFEAGVAEKMVDNLRRIFVKGVDEKGYGTQVAMGNYVEPVHLQIVCFQLWNSLPSGRSSILETDLQAFGNIDEALEGFYNSILKDVSAATGVSQRQLRTWVDEKLITPALTRGLVYCDEEKKETAGLPNTAVERLNEAYLVRKEIRGGATWFELAHDRLIEPVRSSNDQWYQTQLTPFQRQAALWEQNNRSSSFLLREELIPDEQSLANFQGELLDYELDFLKESQLTAQKSLFEREAQTLRPIRRLAVWETFSFIITIIGIIGFVIDTSGPIGVSLFCLSIVTLLIAIITAILLLFRTFNLSWREWRRRRSGNKRSTEI